jgi:GTP-binding protein Era
VAVVGRPNVGKSTFVNALVGTKVSIVSDKPQTTRNRILAVVNRPGGQLVLFDTPGIHKPEHGLNRRMVETAVRSIGMAEIVPLSALSGDNVELAGERLLAHLPPGDALYPEDFLTDRPERFFVAEMVREQILHLTRQEMPYVTGVLVENFKEDGELVRIEASILAERDSQKAILIGKGGSMLKEIGTRARQQIETFLGTRVYLGLFVKVREHWRENGSVLDEMGLGESEGRPHKSRAPRQKG